MSESVEQAELGDEIIRTTDLPSPTSFTMLAWVKRVTAQASGPAEGVLALHDAASNLISLQYHPTTDVLRIVTTGTAQTQNFSVQPAVGDWAYVVLRCSGTVADTLRGSWYDAAGQLQAAISLTGFSFTATQMAIGQAAFGDPLFGRFARLRVYDAALTEHEIGAEMRSVLPVRRTNLNTTFRGTDPACPDIDSGNGRNWSTNGTVAADDVPPNLARPKIPGRRKFSS